jgi:hypothetical protein
MWPRHSWSAQSRSLRKGDIVPQTQICLSAGRKRARSPLLGELASVTVDQPPE